MRASGDDLPRFAELGRGRVHAAAALRARHRRPTGGEPSEPIGSASRGRSGSSPSAGGVLAFSSDWNVAEMDPMTWLYTAMTRADLHGGGAWNLEETIELAAAIRAATLG